MDGLELRADPLSPQFQHPRILFVAGEKLLQPAVRLGNQVRAREILSELDQFLGRELDSVVGPLLKEARALANE